MLDTKLLAKIEALDVNAYGLYPNKLSSLVKEKANAAAVVIALNNVDTDGVLLALLEKEGEDVFNGAKYLASTLGAKEVILNLPDYYEDKKGVEEKAKKAGINVERGIVNVRQHENDLVVHIVTAYELNRALNGKSEAGIFLSVNGGELKKYPLDKRLRDLVGDVKGVRTSYLIRNASDLDLTLGQAGLDNGVLQAINNDTCVVALVAEKLLKDRHQSCGKCVFCREGLLQLEAMVKDMTIGRGKLDYLDLSEEIGQAMIYSTPCSMGQNSSLLPLSAIKAFPEEFEAHIKKKKCPANQCLAFKKYYVDPLTCTGCTKCMEVCPHDSIDGAEGYIHIVFDNTCSKCGKCLGACPNGSIHVTTDALPRLPNKMMRVGRFNKL